MSGIVGSKLNIRGSGLVGSLGTDGQHLLSAGAGKTNVFETAAGGYWNLIKSLTASSDATLSFVNGASDVVLDSTYKQYMVRWTDIHPETSGEDFSFNGSSDAGSNYNVSKTVAVASIQTKEDGSSYEIQYRSAEDSTNETTFQLLSKDTPNDADTGTSGQLIFFNPSGTTFIKHFLCHTTATTTHSPPYLKYRTMGGYFNTTSAVDALQFKWSSGDIDAGQINLYGAT